MGSSAKQTIHEIDFCSQVASAANQLIAQNPAIYPFYELRVEGFGTGRGPRKRKDLRFYGHRDKLVLCGEVKLPGTPEGRSPFDAEFWPTRRRRPAMPESAFLHVERQQVCAFRPQSLGAAAAGRRVWERKLGRTLAAPAEVAARKTSISSRPISCPTCCATWRILFPAGGASGCPRTTFSSAPWKATWTGRSGC